MSPRMSDSWAKAIEITLVIFCLPILSFVVAIDELSRACERKTGDVPLAALCVAGFFGSVSWCLVFHYLLG